MSHHSRLTCLLIGLAVALYSTTTLAENNCLHFNGNQYAAAVSDTGNIPEHNLTIEFWFRTQNANGGIFTNTSTEPGLNGGYDRGISIENGQLYQYLWADAEGIEILHSQGNNYHDGEWHHYAMVVDDNRGQFMYVDGQEAARGNLNHSRFNWSDRMILGHSCRSGGQDRYYSGDIDELRLWSVVRTPDEIRAAMSVPLSGEEDGLVAYYRLDEGEGQSSADDSPQDFALRLGSAAGQDQYDPSWTGPGAPISGAIGEITMQTLYFLPVGAGHSTSLQITIRNHAAERDVMHRLIYRLSDAGAAPHWLTFDPSEGFIEAGDEQVFTFTANAQDLRVGDYQRTIQLITNTREIGDIELPAQLFVREGVGSIHGVVKRSENNDPVEGAVIHALGDFDLQDVSDAGGGYSFADVTSYPYRFLVTAPDFLPLLSDSIVIENGEDRELNFPLLHSRFTPSDNAIQANLPVDDTFETPFTITNTGNGPLAWSVERVFPAEHIADPWTRRQAFNVGANLNDDRLEGACFDGTHFYLAGAAGADSSKIYVLTRDGDFVRSFDQLCHTRYGMKDLEWDGELLWGSGDSTVFGFTTEGEESVHFRGPFNPTNNIAYDSDNNLLWLSGTTTNISAYTREGNPTGVSWNRKGLRIYGLAYWPEDPDGYNLYIFDTPGAGYQFVHKMNLTNGDTLLAYSIPVENGEAPSGTFICNDYDPYSWVMVAMQNIASGNGGDRLGIWQLGNRTDWVQAAPVAGVIEAGRSEEMTVSFNSDGMAEDLRMEATLQFTHDGVGGVTEIPVSMNVTGEGGLTQRLMHLIRGWNLVSVNITPTGGENFDSLLTPLVDANLLVLAKDQAGHFYWPVRGFNGIEGWDGLQSYWLKVSGDSELRLAGTTLAYDHEVPLRLGWNMASYLPRQAVEASVALGGLGNNLIIARDGAGHFYLPAFGFSDIGTMREGSGYQLKVQEATTLIYRLAGRADSEVARYSPAEVSWMEGVTRTGSQYNLLVKTDLEAGTRLEAVTSSGLVAGRGVVGSDGMAGLTLWGDDPTTESVDGFTEGETATIVGKGKMEKGNGASLNSELSTLNSQLAFTDGGWGVIDLTTSAVPVSFGLNETYPNPFNGELRVTFGLTSSGEGRLAAYDLSGREVGVLWAGKASAGEHRIVWNAAGLPSGVYLLRLEAAGLSSTVKVVMVR